MKKFGDVLNKVHVCNDCARKHGLDCKYPADSGKQSILCAVCLHYGIGSFMDCVIGDWLAVIPINPVHA